MRYTSGLHALTVCLVLGAAAPAFAFDAAETRAAVDKVLDADYAHLDALYKDLHQHPELGFMETRTASALAREMRALGFEVTEHIGKTGIVAVYRNGAGPTVLVRTELDALPMEEKTGLPYASKAKQVVDGKETFVAHSCGHDIHMAAWIGAAKALVALKDRWRGTLMFVGQPSEESTSGAKAMLADRLFERFGKPDYGFALHASPEAAGTVAYKPGIISSNSDSLEIRFNGRGAHGSMPNFAIDPVMMAARFIVDVQSVVSREKDPSAFGVVSIGSLQGGSVGNIIPDYVVLRGTVRTYTPEVREVLLSGIRRTAKAAADMSSAPAPDVALVEGGKAVVNDAALTARTGAVFKTAFGDKAHEFDKPGFASEDYSEFIDAGVPSVYFAIGATDPALIAQAQARGTQVPVNHSPLFAPLPELTIRTGVEAMTLAVMNVMTPPGEAAPSNEGTAP